MKMDGTEIKNIPLPEDSQNYASSNQHLPVYYPTAYSDIPGNSRDVQKLLNLPSTGQPPLPTFPPPSNPPLPSVSGVSHILKGKYGEN
jgi:hypothetical protein